jgi:drug/metabolite transporter (DMT)-like permease
MVASSGLLTVNDAMVKWLTQGYPVGQVIALRGTLLVALILVWAVTTGNASLLRVRDRMLQGTRGCLMAASTYLFVTALSLMPIADAIAIGFAGPIIATALAAVLLGESVGWRRWAAVGIGFVGVVLMVRPAPDVVRVVALVTRRMGARGESTAAVVLVSTAIVAVAGFASAPFGWVPVRGADLGLFAVSATLLGLAQALMVESLRLGEVGLVVPFKYTSLVWALILGLIVWGQAPGPWTWSGGVLIVGAGLYIWRREVRLASSR